MTLSPHFSLAEFVASDKARERGIDNSLPDDLHINAEATALMLERIRAVLCERAGREIPMLISSGYRCNELNRIVGGSRGSDHLRAMAADWSAPAFGTPLQLCRLLAPLVTPLAIGQLIYECPRRDNRWVHVSTRVPEKLVNRVITIGPGKSTLLGVQDV